MARRPHPPVLVCGVVRRARQATEEILIGRIPSDPYAGKWTFPGGPVEEGEMPEEALRRALRSLLDLSVVIRVGQPPFDHPWDDIVCRWRFFFCDATSEADNRHFDEIRWIAPGDLREYEFDPVSQQVADWILEDQP